MRFEKTNCRSSKSSSNSKKSKSSSKIDSTESAQIESANKTRTTRLIWFSSSSRSKWTFEERAREAWWFAFAHQERVRKSTSSSTSEEGARIYVGADPRRQFDGQMLNEGQSDAHFGEKVDRHPEKELDISSCRGSGKGGQVSQLDFNPCGESGQIVVY